MRHRCAPRPFVLACCIVLALNAKAQFEQPLPSGRGAAMGGATMTLDDAGSALNNDAGIAFSSNAGIFLSYSQSHLGKGFSGLGAGGIVPLAYGAAGISLFHFGDDDYGEQRVSLHYAMMLNERLSLGVAVHFWHSYTSDAYYPSQLMATFSVGMRYCVSDDLRVGFRVYNPLSLKLRNDVAMNTPSVFAAGVGYSVTDELLIAVDVEKNLFQKTSVKGGLEYVFLDYYRLRVGISTEPTLFSCGAGVEYGHLSADLSATVHQVLGLTPQVSVTYMF